MIARRAIWLAGLVALGACRTVGDELGVPGGRVLRADLRTADGAPVVLWRWSPTDAAAPKVLVVPELGFDHRLVTPLCEALRRGGFDVATLEGRALSGRDDGLAGWHRDVARTLAAFGPAGVLAIGLGGRAALDVAEAAPELVRGFVAVNVPLSRADANLALAEALSTSGFDPATWLAMRAAPVLLAGGRRTPRPTMDRLAAAAHPLPRRLASESAAWLALDVAPPRVDRPLRAFAGVKDNAVQAEQALVSGPGATPVVAARRIGKIEAFSRDYGHLDWLADPDALADVAPVLVAALEALP